jgi:hypothetical protein
MNKRGRNMRGLIGGSGAGRLLGIALGFLALSGCDSLTSSGGPEKARLVLDGSDPSPVEVTTSLNFLVSESQELSFQDLTVDTVAIPFQQTYDIEDFKRFYVLATNIQDQDQQFRMRVTIDGESWYNETKVLEPGETAQFVYRYTEPYLQ